MTIPNLLQAPMGALSAAGVRTSLPARDPVTAPPRYGMTMWFGVKVTDPGGDVKDLGHWSGCSGLAVNLETEPVWAGGQYLAPYLTPKQLTYPNVTLERAMDERSAAQVRKWLERVARQWISGAEGGAGQVQRESGGTSPGPSFKGTTVDVTLFSALSGDGTAPAGSSGRVVAEWHLTDAIPVSWSGPALSASGGGVATEKLVLVHRGFLATAAAGTGSAPLPSEGQGQLKLSYGQKDLVFQFNPKEVGEERTTRVGTEKDGQTLTINGEELIYDRRKLTLSALQIEGVTEVADSCGKLWDWTELENGAPKRVALKMGAGVGRGFDEQVVIKTAKVSYSRFTASGVPCRAVVTLTLLVVERKETEAAEL
ncbi:phage tail protein [Amycolatopsis sp. lyj-23]|uniref:phage tail protein n=1 Tax=Amycolatopsis sp. lyj-23 TaxID=2789283 RepID=UPI00397D610F